MAGNLDIYNEVREVPREAQKPIMGGRLKGMTDINPMWRIQVLTEQFGPCGIGWSYEITKQWIEEGANNEKVAFCNINMFVKIDNEWSKAIPGTGGSSLVAKEKNGLFTSDECFKMALTDAISVSCKSLGIGADIYWNAGTTKYNKSEQRNSRQQAPKQDKALELVQKYAQQAKMQPSDVSALITERYKKPFAKMNAEEKSDLLKHLQALAGA